MTENYFLQFWRLKSEIKVLARLVSSQAFFSGLWLAIYFLSVSSSTLASVHISVQLSSSYKAPVI